MHFFKVLPLKLNFRIVGQCYQCLKALFFSFNFYFAVLVEWSLKFGTIVFTYQAAWNIFEEILKIKLLIEMFTSKPQPSLPNFGIQLACHVKTIFVNFGDHPILSAEINVDWKKAISAIEKKYLAAPGGGDVDQFKQIQMASMAFRTQCTYLNLSVTVFLCPFSMRIHIIKLQCVIKFNRNSTAAIKFADLHISRVHWVTAYRIEQILAQTYTHLLKSTHNL